MSSKAHSLAAAIRDDLAARFSVISAVKIDSDGLPYIEVGTQGAGNQAALVKVMDVAPIQKNIIGDTQANYGNPCVVMLGMELSATAGLSLVTDVNQVALLCTLAKFGCKMEVYHETNGSPFALADFTSGKLIATWYPDLKWKTQSSI